MYRIICIISSLLFILLGLRFLYITLLIEYFKKKNLLLVDCRCIDIKITSNVNANERIRYSVWEYYYKNKKCFWESKIQSNFGLPQIGTISKIAINSDNDKVVFVKSSVPNKIKFMIFSLCFILVGIKIFISSITNVW